jgi:hypothetical protein
MIIPETSTFFLSDFLTLFSNFVSITRILDGLHWQEAGEVEKTALLFYFWTRVGGFVNWTRFARAPDLESCAADGRGQRVLSHTHDCLVTANALLSTPTMSFAHVTIIENFDPMKRDTRSCNKACMFSLRKQQ